MFGSTSVKYQDVVGKNRRVEGIRDTDVAVMVARARGMLQMCSSYNPGQDRKKYPGAPQRRFD